ncbi:hypothetical protein R4P64_29220 [Rhodococcus sp. IEGM 1366]|uniref:hypothetical protein n=1 Tax=Rhodococcus sp. IEGM 1366 TaxID=3082223 RepID=UPI0029548ABA|nr:hypothetical protein [Rhodococcus sp. IEGM 1366]MDV8070621.1 hypothetical protein [Rhodococcus sp. IEGM 1366]
MSAEPETLRVELEEVGARHWWASLLATLASQSGNAYMRFVGVVDGRSRYVSSTFPVSRTLGTVAPQEAWAPEMTASLAELRRSIEDDGWHLSGRGRQPWSLIYRLH